MKNDAATPNRKKVRSVKRKVIEITVTDDSDEDFKDNPPTKKFKYTPTESAKVKTEVSSYLINI